MTAAAPDDPFTEHIGHSTLITLVANAGTLAVTALAILVLPNVLGPYAWGVYVPLFEQIALAAMVLELGGGMILARYGPLWRSTQPERYIALWRNLLWSKLPLAACAFILVILWGKASWAVAVPATGAATCLAIATLANGLLWGTSQHTARALFPLVGVALRIVCVTAGFLLGNRAGLAPALMAYAALYALVYMALAQWLVRLPRPPLRTHRWSLPIETYRAFGLWVFAAYLCYGAMCRTAVILPQYLGLPEAEIGFLGLGLRCFLPILGLVVSVPVGMLTLLIRESERTQSALRRRAQAIGWRYANVLLGLVLGLGLLLYRPFLATVLRADYAPHLGLIERVAWWLAPGIVVLSWANFHGQLALADNRSRQMLLASAVGMLLVVPSTVYGVRWGPQGCAAALSLAGVVYYLLLASAADPITGYWHSVGRVLLGALAFPLAGWLLPRDDWRVALVCGLVAATFYLTLLFATRLLTGEDIERVREGLAVTLGRIRGTER